MYPNAYWDVSNTGSIITAPDRQQYHAQYTAFYDPDLLYYTVLIFSTAGDTAGVVGDDAYVSVSRL